MPNGTLWKTLDKWSSIVARLIAIAGFIVASVSVITPSVREALAAWLVASETFDERGVRLGEWQNHPIEIGRVQQADTDGFLLVFSAGPGGGVARLELDTGLRNSLEWRTRLVEYGSAIMPVREGEFYRFRLYDSKMRVETATAYWIPLESPAAEE